VPVVIEAWHPKSMFSTKFRREVAIFVIKINNLMHERPEITI